MPSMTRDDRDVWPDDVPVGTFSIEESRIQGYPGATAHMLFVCPKGQRCAVLMGPQPVPRSKPEDCYTWGWDGNLDRPTLTPSINCVPPGCGWHGHITAEVMQ